MAKKGKKKKAVQADPNAATVIMRNRRVRHDYEVLDTVEAGIVLCGSEAKSLRDANVQWADAHARFDNKGELWLYGLFIGEYRQAGPFNHAPTARRKLLLHARELRKLSQSLQTKGLTLVPLDLHFRRGYAKCELALVKGKAHQDKRADASKRDAKRDIEREMSRRLRG